MATRAGRIVGLRTALVSNTGLGHARRIAEPGIIVASAASLTSGHCFPTIIYVTDGAVLHIGWKYDASIASKDACLRVGVQRIL